MRAVNLLPRDVERQRSEGGRAPLLVASGGIAAVTAAAIVLFISASGSIDDERARLESVEAAITRITDSGQPALVPGAIARERTDRVAALSAALTTRVPLDRLLRQLAFVLPDDAWLTGMSAVAPADATVAVPATTATQGVTIQGATYSLASVARVLSRLAAIPSLDDVRLAASARVAPAAEGSSGADAQPKATQKTVVTFSIAANLRPGSGS
jgi:Tfp pilus assembly protein PilN